MIRLNVFVRVDEAHRAEFLEVAKKLTERSLKEVGCVAYDIFESATRGDVLMICETWKDAEALHAHEQTPHFVEYVGRMHAMAEMKQEKFNF